MCVCVCLRPKIIQVHIGQFYCTFRATGTSFKIGVVTDKRLHQFSWCALMTPISIKGFAPLPPRWCSFFHKFIDCMTYLLICEGQEHYHTWWINIIIEAFIHYKIDEDPLMCWNPERGIPKPSKVCNLASTRQGRMTTVWWWVCHSKQVSLGLLLKLKMACWDLMLSGILFHSTCLAVAKPRMSFLWWAGENDYFHKSDY